jgi:hypothetical protein
LDNAQALHAFWSSFGVPAYDENTVPDKAPYPRITYDVVCGTFGNTVTSSAQIWDYSKSWATVESIKHEIKLALSGGGCTKMTDDGGIWITPGSPFMQRVAGENDMIRRILINIDVECMQ